MVEMRVGQQDGVELVRVERERDAVADRFVRAALEHPAVDEDAGLRGLEQVLRAGDGRGATEEVDLHGRMVTARGGLRRVSSASHGHRRTVERSFGELLAAFGDLVVARSRGAPAEPPGARSRTLARRYRSAAARVRARRSTALAEPAHVAARRTTRAPSRTCAPRCAWLDELEPTPGARADRQAARPTRTRPSPRARAAPVPALRARRPARSGSAARRSTARRSSAGSRPSRTRARAGACSRRWRRSGGRSTATAAPPARIGGCSARARRGGPTHGSPIEANAAALGLPAGSLEATLHEHPRGVAVGRRVRAGSSRGTTGTRPGPRRGGSTGSCRRTGCSSSTTRYLAALGADRATSGSGTTSCRGPAGRRSPSRSRSGWVAWAADQPPTGPWTPRPPWVFATYAEGGLGNLARAAPRERPRAAHGGGPDAARVPRLSRGERRVPRGHGRRPRLGRRRTRVAAALAGRGRGAARGAPRAATARSCSTSAGRSSRSSSTATPSAARTTSGPR